MKLPTISNNSGISLEMAVWLLQDDYDFRKEENYFSATGLMKPIRHILLPVRISEAQKVIPDVEDFIATAMGQALHAGIEKAWLNNQHRAVALQQLGYPEDVIARVRVNPMPGDLTTNPQIIPVYVEQRAIKEIVVNGVTFKVGGKFDMVCEGRVTDTKSTSVYSWVFGSKDEDYTLQGSIYRWLNQDKITEDFTRINFIFTDWNKFDAANRKDYPAKRVMHKDIPLMSLSETENWIRAKIAQIQQNWSVPENQLPECTKEELWMSDPKHKYYSDPSKANGGAGRSTKNFDDLQEANTFMREKGKGTIITIPGQPKRCAYCAAFPICTQKNQYIHE